MSNISCGILYITSKVSWNVLKVVSFKGKQNNIRFQRACKIVTDKNKHIYLTLDISF